MTNDTDFNPELERRYESKTAKGLIFNIPPNGTLHLAQMEHAVAVGWTVNDLSTVAEELHDLALTATSFELMCQDHITKLDSPDMFMNALSRPDHVQVVRLGRASSFIVWAAVSNFAVNELSVKAPTWEEATQTIIKLNQPQLAAALPELVQQLGD